MSLPKNEDHDKSKSQSIMRATEDGAPIGYGAILTGVGRSAIAVIGITGPRAAEAIHRCFTPATDRPYVTGEIRFGNWHGGQASSEPTGESVVLTRQDDDVFEVHCHGGIAAAERIMDDLRQTGIQHVDRLPRAGRGEHGDVPLLIFEAEAVLSRCLTARTAALALDQVRGAMQDWAQSWSIRLHPDAIQVLHHEVAAILASAPFAVRLSDPFRVVLAGPPNVGKSSLINAIVGYDRSITLDSPGTTRDVLHAETVIDGLPIRLSDTAGLRASSEPIESAGIARAKAAASQADLVVWVTEPGQSETPEHAEAISGKSLNVLNKADLLAESGANAVTNVIKTVAVTGDGVPELMSAIANSFASGFPDPGTPVPLNQRQANLLKRIVDTNDAAQVEYLLQELIGQQNAGACQFLSVPKTSK